MDLGAAKTWASSDLLADEAALFQACGVADPPLAHQLRAALGDVELMPAWHRAGYAPEEILALKAEGCRGPEQAPPPKPKEAPPEPALVITYGGIKAEGVARESNQVPLSDQEEPKPAPPSGPALAPAAKPLDGVQAPTRFLKGEVSWARLRAEKLLGVEAATEAEALAVPLPAGSVWLGWGCLQSQALPEASGDATAFVWQQGGTSLLVVAASELLAPAGKVLDALDMRGDPLWQEVLDPLRAKLGLPRHHGSWLLMASAEGGALAWGLVHPAGPPPWASAVDYQEKETWTARWARKTEEWGEDGKAPNAKVGRLADGSWWIALPEATAAAGAAPQSVGFSTAKPAWTESLQEFCLKMEMPAKAGKWRLFGEPLKSD
jgi:hypothetical protein